MKLVLTQEEKDQLFREYQPQVREYNRRSRECDDPEEARRLKRTAEYLAFEATERMFPWIEWAALAFLVMAFVGFVVAVVIVA